MNNLTARTIAHIPSRWAIVRATLPVAGQNKLVAFGGPDTALTGIAQAKSTARRPSSGDGDMSESPVSKAPSQRIQEAVSRVYCKIKTGNWVSDGGSITRRPDGGILGGT
jgi:hypothetical protein